MMVVVKHPPQIDPLGEVVYVQKQTDQSVSAVTVTVADSELFVPLEADTTYSFEALIFHDSPTAADFKWGWDVPALSTLKYTAFYLASSITTTPGGAQFGRRYVAGDIQGVGGAGAGVPVGTFFKGTIKTGANAGNLQFRFAQLTSDPGSTIVLADSYLELTKRPFG